MGKKLLAKISIFGFRFLALALLLGGLSLRAQTNTVPISENIPSEADMPSAAGMIDSMDALNDDHKLAPGDRISYRVVEDEKDAVSIPINDSGSVNIPLIGLFPAAGKTCKQLADQLKPLLEKDYFYKATVIVAVDTQSTRPRGKVYITGQVHSQGAIELPANESMTVSQAILQNGGLADFADRRRVRLTRKNPDGTTKVIKVDLKEIIDLGHPEKDPVLQPGDTIDVPERLFNL